MWSASKLHPAINQAREYDSVVVVIDDLTEMWRDVVANFHPRNRIEEQRVCLRISHALSLFIKFTYISFSKTKSSIRFLIFSLRISSAFELLEDFDTRFFLLELMLWEMETRKWGRFSDKKMDDRYVYFSYFSSDWIYIHRFRVRTNFRWNYYIWYK